MDKENLKKAEHDGKTDGCSAFLCKGNVKCGKKIGKREKKNM